MDGFMLKNDLLAKNLWGVTSRQQCSNASKRLAPASILGADPYTEHTQKHLIPA
jgi:hypothetical protein